MTKKNTNSNMRHLQYFAAAEGYDAHYSTPGIHPLEAKIITRVRGAVAALTDEKVGQAYPLTERMLKAIRAGCDFSKGEDRTNFAYVVVVQAAMLRHADHKGGKIRVRHMKRMTARGASRLKFKLMVSPGKCHKGFRGAPIGESRAYKSGWDPKSGPIEPAQILRDYLEWAGIQLGASLSCSRWST